MAWLHFYIVLYPSKFGSFASWNCTRKFSFYHPGTIKAVTEQLHYFLLAQRSSLSGLNCFVIWSAWTAPTWKGKPVVSSLDCLKNMERKLLPLAKVVSVFSLVLAAWNQRALQHHSPRNKSKKKKKEGHHQKSFRN